MDAIVALNGKGVALLHEGKRQEACKVFRQAIKGIALIIQASSQEDDTLMEHKEQQTAAMTTGIRCVPVSVNQDVSVLEASFSPENMFNFYHKVFEVVEQVSSADNVAAPGACTSAAAAVQLQLSATLLYNWGVTSHCMAICSGKSEFLQKSLYLYNKAFAVLQCCIAAANNGNDNKNNNNNNNNHHHKETRLLCLALLNNMEHANCYFGNKDVVDALQEHLCFLLHHEANDDDYTSTIDGIETSEHHDELVATTTTTSLLVVEEEENSFFYRSTFLCESGLGFQAAAAAA
jgi:hypothetical protein